MQTSSDPTGNAEDEIAEAREDATERSRMHELHAKYHAFMDEVLEVAKRHFADEAESVAYLFGVQFEEQVDLPGPDCFVGTNVDVEALPMVMAAMGEHIGQYVLQQAQGAGLVVEVDPENVPEAVRRQAEEIAASMGLPASAIEYLQPSEEITLAAIPEPDERVYTDGEPELDAEGTPVVDVPSDRVEGLVEGPEE